jgi:cold-inducible RNA-binding protein
VSDRVFIGNLNYSTTEEDLESFLAAAGSVVDVRIPTDRTSGRARGFAFARFSEAVAARRAIEELNGGELAGRRLVIQAAQERPGKLPAKPGRRLAADLDSDFGEHEKSARSRRHERGSKPRGTFRDLRGTKRHL